MINQNSILLFRKNGKWIAQFRGPMSFEITKATGSNELIASEKPATPFEVIEQKVKGEFPDWEVVTRWDSKY